LVAAIFIFLVNFLLIIFDIEQKIGMKATPEHHARVAALTLASVYPHYVAKVTAKGRAKAELDQVIEWLTGFTASELQGFIDARATFADIFAQATLHPHAGAITGVICGYRIEEIDNPLTRQVRYLDKLVDELAKGRAMEKILRPAGPSPAQPKVTLDKN
jgi:hypothetical protein